MTGQCHTYAIAQWKDSDAHLHRVERVRTRAMAMRAVCPGTTEMPEHRHDLRDNARIADASVGTVVTTPRMEFIT